ncbi:MAG: hypothetical protein KBS93_05950 [Flavobacteriaceae bacterium]|nr:hypothetical protein [Candidatus Onthonaster equi]
MKILTTLLFLFLFLKFNYAQDAMVKDTISVDEIEFITTELPLQLEEISALSYEDRDKSVVSFWGLNDSGNKSELYRFTKDGNIIQTISTTNAPNIDWEEIAIDDNKLFFADFGNNLGNRKDLAIYYINRDEIDLNNEFQSLQAHKIEFFYPEQEHFGYKNLTTNWDAEAFFIYNNQIHVLTKEWTNKATTHYTIPIDSSKRHAAKRIEVYPTDFMVTGAHISTKSNDKGLYIIGYTIETLAILQWFDLPKDNSDLIFTNSAKTTILPLGFTTQLGQLEGISLSSADQNQICMSGEKFKFKGFHAKQILHCFKNFTNQK